MRVHKTTPSGRGSPEAIDWGKYRCPSSTGAAGMPASTGAPEGPAGVLLEQPSMVPATTTTASRKERLVSLTEDLLPHDTTVRRLSIALRCDGSRVALLRPE